MAYFLVTLAHGPAWDDRRTRREQDRWVEHGAFMDGLEAAGHLVLGGPLGADPDAGDALMLVRAVDAAEAAAWFERDPWHGSVLVTAAVEEWALWLGDPGS